MFKILEALGIAAVTAGLAIIASPASAFAAANSSTTDNNKPAAFWDVKTDQPISLDELANRLAGDHNVVMFDEYHDQPTVHQAQQELYKKLTKINKAPVVLSMEMFERDTQKNMDAYLAGKISEEAMLKDSRPWPNYQDDYRPMVETAKEHGYPVLCSNIPRFMASAYAKTGSVDAYNPKYYARNTYAPEGEYKRRFLDAMQENAANGMKVPPMMYEAMYKAQCIKDDTMAESISDYLKANPNSLIYHVQGDFHGAYHLGVAQKLAALKPELPITVIAPVAREAGKNENDLIQENKGIGDYILFFNRFENSN